MKVHLRVLHSGKMETGNELTWSPLGGWQLDTNPIRPMAVMSIDAIGGPIIDGDRLLVQTIAQVPNPDGSDPLYIDRDEIGSFEARSLNIDGTTVYFSGFGLTTGYKIKITGIGSEAAQ